MSKQVKIFLYKVCQVTTTPKSSSQEILTDCTMQNEAFWLRDLLLIKVLLNLYSLTKYQKKVLERGGAYYEILQCRGKGGLPYYGILFLRLSRILPTPSSKLYLSFLLDKAHLKICSD